MPIEKWTVEKSQDVSPSPWFPILKDDVLLPNGKHIEYFRSRLLDVVMVLAITTEHEIVFVRQYKHGIGEVCVELPAGRIEHGNTPTQAAIRELREETGIIVGEGSLLPLGEVWTEPSKSGVRVSGFVVRDVTIQGNQELEETEDIEVVKVPVIKLSSYLKEHNIHASDTLALLLLAKLKFPELFSL